MDNILNINEDCDFKEILLKSPKPVQGGTYFSKLEINNMPILIQTPKCYTKNGIHKTGKKIYCDLKFDNENEKFIEWLMNMEKRVRDLIYEKREMWFHDEPSMEEIEYNWNTSIRTNRSNNYLVRTFIQKGKNTDYTNLQIWDSEQNKLTLEDVLVEHRLISILEIQGLKYTSQSFHLEICMRQIMIIKKKPLFNKCLIQLNNKTKLKMEEDFVEKINVFKEEEVEVMIKDNKVENVDEELDENVNEKLDENVNEKLDENVKEENKLENVVELVNGDEEENKNEENKDEDEVNKKSEEEKINNLGKAEKDVLNNLFENNDTVEDLEKSDPDNDLERMEEKENIKKKEEGYLEKTNEGNNVELKPVVKINKEENELNTLDKVEKKKEIKGLQEIDLEITDDTESMRLKKERIYI